MHETPAVRRSVIAVIIALVTAWSVSGCTYLRHRGEDALDIIDLGVTFSRDWDFALYYDFVPVFPVGYGKVEGRFAGLGAGRLGRTAHREESLGLILWGREELRYGLPPDDRLEPSRFQRSGLAGLVHGPVPGPDYVASCPHYVHLGRVGLVATPRYYQALDFLLGWTTLDIGFDDGLQRGQWSRD
ncbi:MAG: hypothetical protein PVJ27_11035 [Candidatus Brocadiaceae bacterium]|jgi:hypothetical protein